MAEAHALAPAGAEARPGLLARLAAPSEVSEVGVEVEGHFHNAEQQRNAALLGMWSWLITELLLFAGLLVTALVLRTLHPHSVAAAAQHFKLWIGGVNTVVLILSSLAMSGAIEMSKLGRARDVSRCLLLTGGLGAVFLLFKSYEYYRDYVEHMTPFLRRPYELAGDAASQLFVNLYWVTTILHFGHLSIGIGIVWVMAWLASRPNYLAHHQHRIEITGLYWHVIDLVWLIVFPTLYMVNR